MNKIIDQLEISHPDFVAEARDAQIKANAGWEKPPSDFVDTRIFECPDCKSPGLNTCWGYVAYVCGAEILSEGEVSEPCPKATP